MHKNPFQIIIRVRNEVGVLTRIVTLLRKYQINIRALHISPIDKKEEFSDMFMELETKKADLEIVINKLERLIPVIEVKKGKHALLIGKVT